MRVLIVEDYRPIRESVARGLREAGFAVDSAENGREGLWLATTNDFGRNGAKPPETVFSHSLALLPVSPALGRRNVARAAPEGQSSRRL